MYIDGLATYRSEKQGHCPKEQNFKKIFYNWFLEKYTDWFTYTLYMSFAISIDFQGLYAHVLKGQNIFYSIYNTYAFFIVSE